MWIFAEAKLDVYSELYTMGRATEEEVQVRRSEARAAHEACWYSSNSPDRKGYTLEDIDRLDSNSWYNEIYCPVGDVQGGKEP